MNTDTPRTEAARFEALRSSAFRQDCIPLKLGQELERELAASQAEVKEIRSALGDDGRRTHKEILEMAFKASGWKLWKEKYIDLRNAHIAEGQDPAGTIWEHADKLQKELKASQAEVERLTKRPFGCKCETLREKALGDGCDECNKALVIEMLTDERDELEAEVARLRERLVKAEDLIKGLQGSRPRNNFSKKFRDNYDDIFKKKVDLHLLKKWQENALHNDSIKVIRPKGSMERYKLVGSDRVLLVHPKTQCAGQHCCIHNPSDHHMKEWPQNWREDRGIMERICPHGIGHPDPDDPAFKNLIEGVHGCDGCCSRFWAESQAK